MVEGGNLKRQNGANAERIGQSAVANRREGGKVAERGREGTGGERDKLNSFELDPTIRMKVMVEKRFFKL